MRAIRRNAYAKVEHTIATNLQIPDEDALILFVGPRLAPVRLDEPMQQDRLPRLRDVVELHKP